MRIRHFRREDGLILFDIQREAARVDGLEPPDAQRFAQWLGQPGFEDGSSIFVITDEDEEFSTWGQGETLDGLEGDIVGYTTVLLQRDPQGYHLLCQGAVHPQHRRQNVGWGLLIGALNHARLLASEFEFEAEQRGEAVYFEALLPVRDAASPRLAARCEMELVHEEAAPGLQLYRRAL